jgi:aspartate/methionine/tyrosine aminotransferase
LRQLLELAGAEECERILDAKVGYAPAAGTPALGDAIAEMQGVQPDEVQVTTGAAEALLVRFSLATEPGANVLVPSPGFPPFDEVPRRAARSATTRCSARTPIARSSTPSAL